MILALTILFIIPMCLVLSSLIAVKHIERKNDKLIDEEDKDIV